MEDDVLYMSRKVSREGFRVYVFGMDDTQKLVNSYDDYEAALASGWFSSKEETVKKMVQVDLPQISDLKKQSKRG